MCSTCAEGEGDLMKTRQVVDLKYDKPRALVLQSSDCQRGSLVTMSQSMLACCHPSVGF